MGAREGHPAGTFCWTDLSTPDPQAATEFYRGLFGWEAEDMPVAGGGAYTMMRLRGRDVAAVAEQPTQQREAGVPPMWNCYVAVASADAAAARVRELGGEVHAGPFDVLEAGRMAVARDPQGAFFELWEPRGHPGAGLVNEPGALVWNELSCPEPHAAAGFYGALLGWSAEELPETGELYLSASSGGRPAAGIRAMRGPGPAHWLVYFGTGDTARSAERVLELGGRRLEGPIEIPAGSVAFVTDPQGAVFALYEGELDP